MQRTLLQIVSDSEITHLFNFLESTGKRGDGCLMALVIIGQIHEAALRDDKQRVLDLLPWLENSMIGLSDSALALFTEAYSTLQLAATDAPIERFPDWVRHFYPYEVEPTSSLWGEGDPPRTKTIKPSSVPSLKLIVCDRLNTKPA